MGYGRVDERTGYGSPPPHASHGDSQFQDYYGAQPGGYDAGQYGAGADQYGAGVGADQYGGWVPNQTIHDPQPYPPGPQFGGDGGAWSPGAAQRGPVDDEYDLELQLERLRTE